MKAFGKHPEEFTPIDEAVSTIGKYAIAFGQHFRPTLCYDVLALNRDTGECIRRHYGDRKDEALAYWQWFKQTMTGPRTPSEEDEQHVLHEFAPSNKPN